MLFRSLDEYRKHSKIFPRLKGFRHMAGQPPEVRQAFLEAFGLTEEAVRAL